MIKRARGVVGHVGRIAEDHTKRMHSPRGNGNGVATTGLYARRESGCPAVEIVALGTEEELRPGRPWVA